MKHTAKYIDSGFYRVSDRAAGELVRANGEALPRHGWGKTVTLSANGVAITAELMRTAYSPKVHLNAPARGWVWALHYFKPERALGHAFVVTARAI